MLKHPVLTHVTRKRNPMLYNPHDPNKAAPGRKYLFDPRARVYDEKTSSLPSLVSGSSSSSGFQGLHAPQSIRTAPRINTAVPMVSDPNRTPVQNTADQSNSRMLQEHRVPNIANLNVQPAAGVHDFAPMDRPENAPQIEALPGYTDNVASNNLAGHVAAGDIGPVFRAPAVREIGNYPDPNPFGNNIGHNIIAPPSYVSIEADVARENALHSIEVRNLRNQLIDARELDVEMTDKVAKRERNNALHSIGVKKLRKDVEYSVELKRLRQAVQDSVVRKANDVEMTDKLAKRARDNAHHSIEVRQKRQKVIDSIVQRAEADIARKNALHSVTVKSLREAALQSMKANIARQNALHSIEVGKLREKVVESEANNIRKKLNKRK